MPKPNNNTGSLINVKHNTPKMNARNQSARIQVVKERRHYLACTLTDEHKPDHIFSEFQVDDQGDLIIQPYLF